MVFKCLLAAVSRPLLPDLYTILFLKGCCNHYFLIEISVKYILYYKMNHSYVVFNPPRSSSCSCINREIHFLVSLHTVSN